MTSLARIAPKAGYTEKNFDKVLAEVEEAVGRHSDDWRQLQSRIWARVREYQKMGTLRSGIYNIYSREDRQSLDVPHRHLKASAQNSAGSSP